MEVLYRFTKRGRPVFSGGEFHTIEVRDKNEQNLAAQPKPLEKVTGPRQLITIRTLHSEPLGIWQVTYREVMDQIPENLRNAKAFYVRPAPSLQYKNGMRVGLTTLFV